ncbi:MAG: hypothetical protein JW983_08045 [Elusimicrobia bacterium]|nr:hypothetical protein [Elusimicrobiota bacterium]
MKKGIKFILILICLAENILSASEDNPSIDGYYKNYFQVLSVPEPDGLTACSDVENIRLKLFYNFDTEKSLNLAYTLSPQIQNPALSGISSPVSFEGSTYRAYDLAGTLSGPKNGFTLYQNLDRAFLKWSTGIYDVSLGRQAVAWGSARVINPTDIFNPYALNALDTEERTGIDAVRIRIPTGTMSEFDTGYVLGKNLSAKKSAFFIRNKSYIFKTDASAIIAVFRQNLMTGMDIARSLGGAGIWLESAYVFVDALSDYEDGKDDNYFKNSAGIDYTFTDKIYGFLEYHYNGAGASREKDYLSNLSKPAFTEDNTFLLGRHYLMPGITYQISALAGLAVTTIVNLQDGSFFLSPSIEYNLTQNSYLSLGSFSGIGKDPETVVTGGTENISNLRSEFGSYTGIFYASFRFYY